MRDDDFMAYKRPDGEGHGVIVKAGDRYYHVPKVIKIECEAVYDERNVMWEVCTEELWEQYKNRKELEEPSCRSLDRPDIRPADDSLQEVR